MAASILIIEDVDSMRCLLEHLIQSVEGLSVSGLAASGWEARLEVHRRRPDLVLLDEVLPGESSEALLNEFRVLLLPVLLISGAFDTERPLWEGALGRLQKPTWDSLEGDQIRFKQKIRAALARNSSQSG